MSKVPACPAMARPLPAELVFFLHVDELALLVIELILQESQLLAGHYAHTQSILHLPPPLQGNEPLIDEGSHVGMHVQGETAYANLVDETVNLALQLVGKQDA